MGVIRTVIGLQGIITVVRRIEDGKKFTAIDERYLNQAKGCLYGEMAVALDMDRDDVEDYRTKRIGA